VIRISVTATGHVTLDLTGVVTVITDPSIYAFRTPDPADADRVLKAVRTVVR
jgi:hypothetical protein